jgi:Xaa-Pro dipeptidase
VAEIFPTFSAAERDRRWTETREKMARAGIAALAMPASGGHWDQFFANQRYLSQIGGNQYRTAMVFPLDGDPTLVIPGIGEAVHWRKISWVEDIRGSDGHRYGKVLADRLRELKLEAETIGVPLLQSPARAGESPIPSGAVEALREALPRAQFVDASALMDEQRSIKSDEEVAMMERASAIAERGIFMLGYHVRAGMPQTEALAVLEGAMLKAGCELSNQILWECSPKPGRTWWHPMHIPIEQGDILQNELEAKIAGYSAREVHPICVGKPEPRVYEMFDLSAKTFDKALPLLKPGAAVDEVVQMVREAGEGTPYRTSLTSYGTGMAQEELGPADDAEGPAVYHERQVMIFKPVVRAEDGLGINFCSTVLVTPEGGKRLSRRPLELMLTSRSLMSAYVKEPSKEPTAPWLRV